jgi:hypothetical protein
MGKTNGKQALVGICKGWFEETGICGRREECERASFRRKVVDKLGRWPRAKWVVKLFLEMKLEVLC